MHNKTDNNKKPSIIRYLLLSLAGLLIALAVGAMINVVFIGIFKDNPGTPVYIVGMLEGIIGAIAAGLVLYQLKLGEKTEERQNDIERASFLLQLNQSFIQDKNMSEVESLLEDQVFYDKEGEIITKDNRQKFVNYLVYLEGMAPLVFNGVLPLDYIDDLMAYRFFMAMENVELQNEELKKFPEYYRGCIKLYKEWIDYRNGKTPCDECTNGKMAKLSDWEQFEKYAQK